MSFLQCLPATPGNITLSSWGVISLALSVLILIYGSIKAYHSKDLSIHLKIIYYLATIAFLCSVFGYSMCTILPLTHDCLNLFGIWPHLGHWGYGAAFVFMYILFLHRIRDTFKSTEYRISIYLLIPLYSGFFVILISHILIGYYYIVLQWDKAHIAGLIYMASNTFYSFCLLFLFAYKIYKLYSSIFNTQYTKTTCTNNDTSNIITSVELESTNNVNTNNDTYNMLILPLESKMKTLTVANTTTTNNDTNNTLESTTINKQEIVRTEIINEDEEEDDIMDKLFQPLIKYILSLTTCIITTIFTSYFMNMYRGYIGGDTIDLINIHHGLIVIDSFVNIIGLHLQFSYFSFLYNILCFPCNRGVRSLISRHKKNKYDHQ
eukprot:125984_1